MALLAQVAKQLRSGAIFQGRYCRLSLHSSQRSCLSNLLKLQDSSRHQRQTSVSSTDAVLPVLTNTFVLYTWHRLACRHLQREPRRVA